MPRRAQLRSDRSAPTAADAASQPAADAPLGREGLAEEVMRLLEERGVPSGAWLVDIAQARTALREAIPAYFGLREPLDVAEALHLGEISWDRLASLVPVIMQVADAGDEVARGIVLRLAKEIFLLARSAINRLGLDAEPVPVVLGGGTVWLRHEPVGGVYQSTALDGPIILLIAATR